MTDQTPAQVQSLNPSNLVELYELDLSLIGHNIQLYFTPSQQSGLNLSFGGIVYTSAAVFISGFKKNSDGSSVEPQFSLANVNHMASAILQTYGDIVGAVVTRRRTFKRFLDFLDDGVTANPEADSNTQFLPEIWYVEQKTDHNRTFVRWIVSAITDFSGQMLPGRRIWKDLCERNYRVYVSGTGGSAVFNYTNVNCPYTGTAYFDINGASSTAANDACGKSFKHCLLRFPDPDTLPGYFFPGVQRVQGYVGSS